MRHPEVRTARVGVALLATACSVPSPPSASVVDWPKYGPQTPGLELSGHTNTVVDVVGPVDGSAQLTIITEGNHYPVLLPLLLEEFPEWTDTSSTCGASAGELLIITLPQVMMMKALRDRRITLGNLVVPLDPTRVYPDIVMGGIEPLRKLAQEDIVEPSAVAFAKHRGMALLVRKTIGVHIESLADLPKHPLRMVLATPYEAGARSQYLLTLNHLLGEKAAELILTREVDTFDGRLRIQHRDVPYALLSQQSDVGLLFAHLARFYARRFPKQLSYVGIDGAAAFGTNLYLTRASPITAARRTVARCFTNFFLEKARTYYPARGFASADDFAFGITQSLELDATHSGRPAPANSL